VQGNAVARIPIIEDNPANLPPATLLLVDDDRFMLDLLADVLAADGYRILRASSGPEALALLAHQRVQPHILRIILSAQDSAGPIAAALADGSVDRYHAKPWHADELRSSIRDALRLQRRRDAV
jgi:CheY-like chemotaxis protein